MSPIDYVCRCGAEIVSRMCLHCDYPGACTRQLDCKNCVEILHHCIVCKTRYATINHANHCERKCRRDERI